METNKPKGGNGLSAVVKTEISEMKKDLNLSGELVLGITLIIIFVYLIINIFKNLNDKDKVEKEYEEENLEEDTLEIEKNLPNQELEEFKKPLEEVQAEVDEILSRMVEITSKLEATENEQEKEKLNKEFQELMEKLSEIEAQNPEWVAADQRRRMEEENV
nr:hypothetical protein [uncultured Kingella sp.]